MVEKLAEKVSADKVKSGFIDCDIHNQVPSDEALKPYMSARWWKHHQMVGPLGYYPFADGYLYPKGNPDGRRMDSYPPSGLPPGGDLDFMREQLLDPLNVEYGILNCLYGEQGYLNGEYGAALARAVNDWQIAEWLEREPRLKASIVVPYECPELAVEEIDRVGEHPGFAQILLLVRTSEPLGRRKYWKIYEAAERHGLPVGIHFAGVGGNAITSSGWPSYYIEEHTGMAQAFQSQVTSLVCEGVFEQFPGLRVVLVEGGFAWLPPLMWRLDKHWKRLKDEVPHLKRLPSEYIKEHIWLTTQPMEEPSDPRHLLKVIDHLDSGDKLMFATDYPHWDYDEPDRAFPVRLPDDLKRKVFSENARSLYRLGESEERQTNG